MVFGVSLLITCLMILLMATIQIKIESASSINRNGRYQNYKNHSCLRNCSDPNVNNQSMICEYDFTLETFSSMGRGCFNCPLNLTDCFREQCIPTDGFMKAIQVVNRMLPGPSIQVCKGDTVVVNVENRLRSGEVTSIHWHGMRQKMLNFMDGPSMITQCPILPHNSFQFVFRADDPGTHMWHSHSAAQYADGVFGSLIIRQSVTDPDGEPNSNLYDFDLADHVIMLNDNAHLISSGWTGEYLYANGYNLHKSILINGMGIQTFKNMTSSIKNKTPIAQFNVAQNGRYRFRLIDIGVYSCTMKFSIDNHNLTIISIDGNPIEPVVEVESLVILPGERYDFVLNARQDVANYFIKVMGVGHLCRFDQIFQVAQLHYEGATNKLNTDSLDYVNVNRLGKSLKTLSDKKSSDEDISIADLRSKQSSNATRDFIASLFGQPNKKYYMKVDMEFIDSPEFHQPDLYSYAKVHKENGDFVFHTPTLTGVNFMMPSSPLLYNNDKNDKTMRCNETNWMNFCSNQTIRTFCHCIQVYELDLNDLVEIILVDPVQSSYSHPMHLHGHHFAVIGTDMFSRDITMDELKEMDNNGTLRRNFQNPLIRDTVSIPYRGYTILRFRADNPGYWLFHCHILLHAENGMTMVFKVGDEKRDFPKEPVGWPKCGSSQFRVSQPLSSFLDNKSNKLFSFSSSSSRIKIVLIIYIFIIFIIS